jgi:hypothetical protein
MLAEVAISAIRSAMMIVTTMILMVICYRFINNAMLGNANLFDDPVEMRHNVHRGRRTFVIGRERLQDILDGDDDELDELLDDMLFGTGIDSRVQQKDIDKLKDIKKTGNIDEDVIRNVTPIKTDSQNVHDHMLVESVNTVINTLMPVNQDICMKEVIDSLVEYRSKTSDDLALAVDVLRRKINDKRIVEPYKITTADAIRLVYPYADPDALIEALASCVEKSNELSGIDDDLGEFVCDTGIINKVMGAVEGTEIKRQLDGVLETIVIPYIKTSHILKREMLEKAAKLRQDYEVLKTSRGFIVENEEDDDKKFRDYLLRQYQLDYPFMTPEDIKRGTSEWINCI